MKFDLQRLVKPLSAEATWQEVKELKFEVACILCGIKFQSARRGSVHRHYTSKHGYTFTVERGEKRSPAEEDSHEISPKKPKRSEKVTVSRFPDKESFTNWCVRHQVLNSLPLKYWNSPTTRELVSPFEEVFKVSVDPNTMKELNLKTAKRIISSVPRLLREKFFHLVLDVTCRQRRNFLAVSVQFAEDEEFGIRVVNLGVLEVLEDADNLQGQVTELIHRFGLQMSQIYSCTMDNGGNCLNSSDLELEEIPGDEMDEKRENDLLKAIASMDLKCFPIHSPARILQLAVNDAMKDSQPQIEVIQGKFEEICKHEKLSVPSHRWSSTLVKAERLLRVKKAVENQMPPEMWKFVEELAEVFQPLQDLQQKFQTVHYVLGDLIRDIYFCMGQLRKTNNNQFAKKVFHSLTEHQTNLIKHPQFAAAVYLDPRLTHKRGEWLNEDNKEMAVKFLLETAKKLDIEEREENPVDPPTEESKDDLSWFVKNAEFLNNTPLKDYRKPSLGDRLKAHSQADVPVLDFDVMRHWKMIADKDPEMAELARVVMSVPASQVTGERMLREMSTIMKTPRDDNSVFLKLNYDFI